MSKNYRLVRVSKTLSRELVSELFNELDTNFGVSVLGNSASQVDKQVVDTLSRSVYNRLRRQATADGVVEV